MFKTLFFLAFLGFCIVNAQNVIDVTSDPAQMSRAGGHWFVKFYAPWCSHCMSLVGTWEELAKLESHWRIAKVDCTVAAEFCQQNQVKGYPTLKLLHYTTQYDPVPNVQEYQGPRQIESFREFLNRHNVPAIGFTENSPKAKGPKNQCIQARTILKKFFKDPVNQQTCELNYDRTTSKALISCSFDGGDDILSNIIQTACGIDLQMEHCDFRKFSTPLFELNRKLTEVSKELYQPKLLVKKFLDGIVEVELSNFPPTALLC